MEGRVSEIEDDSKKGEVQDGMVIDVLEKVKEVKNMIDGERKLKEDSKKV